MGSRGPLADRRLQVLKGDSRNRDYPKAVVAAPDKPPDLEPDAERLWDTIVPELERMRLLSRLDGVTLEALCTTYARWRQHDGGLGYPALTNVLAKLARDMGLAPAARQRLTAPEPTAADEAAIRHRRLSPAPRRRSQGPYSGRRDPSRGGLAQSGH